MRRTGKIGASAWIVRLVCMAALVFVSFAHRPAQTSNIDPAELAAYMLPDGSLPDLCVTTVDEDGKTSHHVTPCEFCRIASACALPLPTDLSLANSPVDRAAAPRADIRPAVVASIHVRSQPPQGPPSFTA